MKPSFRLTLLAGLIALPLVATACSGSGGGGSSAGSHTTLYVVATTELADISPFTATQQGKSEVLDTIGMPILHLDANNKLASSVLKSWTISDDARDITLTMKSGLRWSDGTPMTATDMLMSLTAYLDPEISSNAGRVGAVEGADALAKDGSTPLKDVHLSGLVVSDDHTLKIKLAAPDVSWLAKLALAGDYWPILPAHVLGDDQLKQLPNDKYFTTWPVSSGPYMLSKSVSGQYVEVVKNPKWSFGTPGFDKVVFKILSTDQMEAQLQTGEVDFAYAIPPSDAARVKDLNGVTLIEHQGVAPDTIGLNYASPALKDPRVRQAMIYAINRQQICKQVLAGHCTVPETNIRQIGPSWAIPTTGVEKYTYDPQKAKQLLAAAGWNPSTKLVFLYRTDNQPSYANQAITIMQGQEAAVGIHIQLKTITTPTFLDIIKKTQGWDAFWVSGANFTVDPDSVGDYMRCDERYPDGPNTSQYCNPEVDKLFKLGKTQTDQTARAATYQHVFRILNHDPSEIYLYNVNNIAAYNSHLVGPVPFGYNADAYWDIGKWHWQS